MSPDLIKAFIKVAENESFSVAAEQLYLTQSAISKRVAHLESQFDFPLFDRIGRSVRLTEAGKIVFKRSQEILKLIEKCKHEVTELSGKAVGTINISTSHHIGLYRLPSLLQCFVRDYPQIKINMQFTDSEIAYQDVIEGDADIAIATLPEIRGKSNNPHHEIKQIHYWTDHLVIVCNKTHPLNQTDNVSILTLSRHPAILPGFETFTRRIIQQTFEKNHIDIPIAFSTNYLETIKHMVLAGLGWSILPRIMVDDSLKIIDIPEFKAQRRLGVLINDNISHSHALNLLLAHIENYVK